MGKVVLALAWLVPMLALAGAVHRHGEGVLQLVVDGTTVEVTLVIPAQDVVGFEHAPQDARQQQQIAEALARLGEAGGLVWPAPAACQRTLVEVADPFHEHQGDHADIVARYQFQCAVPDALHYLDVVLLRSLPGLRLRAEAVSAGFAWTAVLDAQQQRLILNRTL